MYSIYILPVIMQYFTFNDDNNVAIRLNLTSCQDAISFISNNCVTVHCDLICVFISGLIVSGRRRSTVYIFLVYIMIVSLYTPCPKISDTPFFKRA